MKRSGWTLGMVVLFLILSLGGCTGKAGQTVSGEKEDGTESGYFGALKEQEDSLEYSLAVDSSQKVRYQAPKSEDEIQGYQATIELSLKKELQEATVLEILADILHHEMACNKTNIAECVAIVQDPGKSQTMTLRYASGERRTICAYFTEEYETEEPVELANEWVGAKDFYMAMELNADSTEYETLEDQKKLSGLTKGYEVVLLREADRQEVRDILYDYIQTLESIEKDMDMEIEKPIERQFDIYQYDDKIESVGIRYTNAEMEKQAIYDKEEGRYWEDVKWE